MSFLSHVATLSLNELRVLGRDRQAAALLFGMPAVFVLFLSLALKDVYGEKVGARLAVVLEVKDDGGYARRIEDSLRARRELTWVPRPDDTPNETLFRTGVARAAVRIPAGFSADAEAFLSQSGGVEFGPHKIEWEASPTLDASYRRLLESYLALTFLDLVRAELARGQAKLGDELEQRGVQMESMGAELEEMGLALDEAGLRAEEMGVALEEMGSALQEASALSKEMGRVLLESTPEELEAFAAAAIAEATADAEAEAARAVLAAGAGGEAQSQVTASVTVARLDGEARGRGSDSGTPGADGAGRAVELRAERERAELTRRERADLERPDSAERRAVEDARRRGRRSTPATGDEAGSSLADADVFLRETAGDRDALPTPLQQTVPGWSLFAMFFIVVPLSQGVHRERTDGTLRRALALGVSRGAVLFGKLVPYVLVGVLQFAGMLGVGLYVVPLLSDLALDFGQEPWVLVPITLAGALAATSYALLVATVARTPEQAAAFGATSVVVLSVLGGVMVPHFVMPQILQKVALASPMYWGHKAYLDAFLHGAGLREVALSLEVLVGFAVVCLTVAALRLAR